MNERWSRAFRSPRVPWVSLLVLLALMEMVYLWAEHRAIHGFGFGLDDSWIHATFARNLVEGRGYALNPGELTSGSTAPLYTLLLAGWYALFGEVIWGAKLLGIAGLAAAALLLYRAIERLAENRLAAWMSAALCVASPPLLWSSLNGMEIGVYLISPCAALYFWSRRSYRWMVVMLAVGVWFRPEALVLLGLGWLAVPARQKVMTAVLAAAILVPYFAMNYALGGYPFPGTVRTKARFQGGHFGLDVLTETGRVLYYLHFLPMFVLAPLGFLAFWKKAWWAALFPPLFFVIEWGSTSTVASVGRYLYPSFPYLYVTVALGIPWLLLRKPSWAATLRVIGWVVVIGQAFFGFKSSFVHAASVENITHMQVLIGRTIPEVTGPQDTVATNDIGAIGYFSNRYVLDLMGLTSPYRSLDNNLRLFHPQMLAIFDSWFPDRMHSPTFVSRYYSLGGIGLTRNVVCGDSVMSLYARDDCFQRMDSVIGDVINREMSRQ